MGDSQFQYLLDKAWQCRDLACASYSNFAVGACLECEDGSLFVGCNVESSSYGLTCCAERVALFSALAAGKRQFKRIAVVADTETPCPPCGACRQVLLDYAPELLVVQGNRGAVITHTIRELIPFGFNNEFLR